MYCTNCRREWKAVSRFCVLCGRELGERSNEERLTELRHVDWLLDEITRWDRYGLTTQVRRQLKHQYETQRELLFELTQVEAAPPVQTSPMASEAVLPPDTTLEAVAPAELREPQRVEEEAPAAVETETVAEAEPAAPAEPVEADAPEADEIFTQPKPSVDDRVVAAASTWNRIWKPFLSESVGWFIGGFLILVGTLWLVGDAWQTLSDSSRALTVFGFAGGWTLAFVTWARFLLRREHTQGAGVVLERIAAIIAPLATVAVGPIRNTPILFWSLVLGWSVAAAWLARAATRRVDERGAWPVATAIGISTVMMGAAPLVAGLGPNAIWFSMVPVALCAVAWYSGPRERPQATWFLFTAMLYAAALFVIRVEVALRAANVAPNFATYSAMIAGLATCALWLRRPSSRAADVWSVGVVSAQSLLLVPAFTGQAPAFVVTALLASATSARLALERVSKASARWVVPAYVFAYLAFMNLKQLVPGFVDELLASLKARLGYEASQSMPASYVSIYAAIFVVIVGLVAAYRFTRETAVRLAEADMLLWCTSVASVFFGAMAVLSLGDDVRPAIVATPLLALLGLGLGFGLGRRELTVAGSVLAVLMGISYGVWLHSPVPMALVALALAAMSIVATQKHRDLLSLASVTLITLTALASWSSPMSLGQPIALALASAAALAVARNLDDSRLMAAAWALPLMLVIRSTQLVHPELAPLALAVASLVGAVASRGSGRLQSLWVPASLAAIFATAWHVGSLDPSFDAPEGLRMLVGLELPLSAAALLGGSLLARRRNAGAFFVVAGILIGAMALMPAKFFPPGLWWMTPHLSISLCIVLAAGCSWRSIREGRMWMTVLTAAAVSCVGLLDVAAATEMSFALAGIDFHVMALIAALLLLAATPALIASVTIPLISLLLALTFASNPPGLTLVATMLTALALAEEFDFTWKYLLNRSRVGWVASLSALVPLMLMWASEGLSPVFFAPMVLLPMVWVRASRSRVLSAASLLLSLGLSVRLGHSYLFVAPVAAVMLSRLTDVKAIRDLLRIHEPTLGHLFVIGALTAAGATVAMTHAESTGPSFAIAWAIALVLMRDNLLPIRIVAAALALALVTPAWPVAALVFTALAFALHHGETRVSRVFGADSAQFGATSAIVAAVGLSSLELVLHGGPTAHLVFAVAVLSAAVLFDWVPAVVVAVASLGFDAHGLTHGSTHFLTPFAFEAALGGAIIAALLRVPQLGEPVEAAWSRLGRGVARSLATPTWLGAFVIGLLALPQSTPSPMWLLLIPLLVLTPDRVEAGLALGLGAVMVVLAVPPETAGVLFAISGAVLAWSAVFLESRFSVLRVWHHVGWVLALISLGLVTDLHSRHLAEVWALMAVTMWAVAKRSPKLEVIGFSGTLAAAHAVLAHLGIALATGAPHELILPWFSAASMLVAGWPLLRNASPSRSFFGLTAAMLSVLEISAAVVLLERPYAREAMVGVAAMGLGVVLLARRAWQEDNAASAIVAQLSAITGAAALYHVGLGLPLSGLSVTWAMLALGFVLSELAKRASENVASALRFGAFAWPVLGLVALVGASPASVSLVLLAVASHFAIVARSPEVRGRAAVASAVAFNAAMFFGYQSAALDGPQYLAIPFGVSMLVLVWVFKESLEVATSARLRAIAVTIIYSAAAWGPLRFGPMWALWLCVLICVIGVALGIVLRIRSFVFLGTGFMVVSIAANLVSYGIREPRLGAIFLSALGLLVVGFMVLVTTKRAQLLEQYRSVQQLLSRWES